MTGEGLNTNFVQVVPMSYEEKVRMYMRCTKLELAKMLAERDRMENIQPVPLYPYPNPWDGPIYTNSENPEVNY